MNRFCVRHSHRGSSRAHRMLLARHSYDADSYRRVLDEHGDCPDCLRDTVKAAIDVAHSLLIRSWPIPEMDANDVVTGASIDWLLERLDMALQCEQADRRDAG
jgi:hypothetical protein